MDGVNQLPEDVRAFLNEYVESIEALSVLLALLDAETRWWNARAMAMQSGVEASSVRRILESYASRNLLDIRISDDVRYQLRPGTPELEDALHRVAAIYRVTPRTLLQWAASRPKRGVADFSDAFRFTKR